MYNRVLPHMPKWSTTVFAVAVLGIAGLAFWGGWDLLSRLLNLVL
ncbi:MAG: hypothetical protein OXH64_10835 [Rhodospirillaceae bacterium]|nr:hypothetical protein [Rhodospirillaceae bacterium]